MSKLWDICSIKSSKRIFESEYVEMGIPFIRWQEVSDKSILDKNAKFECYISKERYEEIKKLKWVPQKWDILITAVWTIWNLCYLPYDIDFYFKDWNILWLSNFQDWVYEKYIYYFMKSPFFKTQLEYSFIWAVQKALTIDMLSKIELVLPSYEEQQKIAKILSTIDDKIELNNKVNSELEAMAKELYEYRFIQFDFPDKDGKPYKSSRWKMIWNKELKREIPEGWEVKTLGDSCEIYQPGILFAKDCIEDGEYFVHGSNWIIWKYNDYNHENSEIIVSCRWDCWNIHRTLPKMWITWNAMVIRLKDKSIHNEYLYQSLFYAWIKNISTGSVQWQITRANISPLKIIIPSRNIIDKFNKIVIPTVDEKLKNLLENQKLSELRDFLLPMLMNGQVTVK